MTALKISAIAAVVTAALSIGVIKAQQPTPPMVVVQAAAPAPTATPAAAAAASDAAVTAAIKALEELKGANDATLKKQETMLQQLDELQKAAEQLKIFTKRV